MIWIGATGDPAHAQAQFDTSPNAHPASDTSDKFGSVTGFVREKPSGHPLGGIAVNVYGVDDNAAGFAAISAEDGSYSIKNLPPGQYRLSVVPVDESESLLRVGRESSQKVITLRTKEALDRCDLIVAQRAAVAGKVTDDEGAPVSNAVVTAVVNQRSGGQDLLLPFGTGGQTDDRGVYKIHDLPPGRYLLRAGPVRGEVTSAQTEYAVRYFPNVEDVGDAAAIDIGPGQELPNLNFTLVKKPVYRVSGKVTAFAAMPEGKPVLLSLTSVRGRLWAATAADDRQTFRIEGLPAGSYRVRAMTVGVDHPVISEMRELNITDHDIDNVVLAPGGTVRVPVILQPDSGDPPLPNDVAGRLSIRFDSDERSLLNVLPSAARNDGGALEVSDVYFGVHYRILIRNIPPPYYVKSIEYGGANALLGITPLPAVPLEITLGTGVCSLSGILRDSDGKPYSNGFVLIVPADYWDEPARRLPAIGMEADQYGSVVFSQLRPGRYLVYAFDSYSRDRMDDVESLRRYRTSSIDADLGPGQNSALDLRIIHFED